MPDNPAETAPVGVDPNLPSIARAYDYLLGGSNHYDVDRQVIAHVSQTLPEMADLAIENRNFLIRACRFIASETSLEQFIDCGSGLPTAENVHQIIQRTNREARVIYIDNDPVVLAHGRALLEENEHTHFISANIFKPREVLDHEVVRSQIDLTEPVGFFQFATLHHFPGSAEQAAQIMREYIEPLPSGSYIAISHFLDPEDEYSEAARSTETAVKQLMPDAGTWRTRNEIEEMFDGLELVEPGLVPCVDWWPDGPRLGELNLAQRMIAGGVARKP